MGTIRLPFIGSDLQDELNLMGPKTHPTIWGTYKKLVTKYQISTINSCWENCNEKCAYMFNVYKNQLSRQTGSRNLTSPKTLPTIIWSQASCRYPISWITFLDPSDSYFLFAKERGYHKWALAHSSSCFLIIFQKIYGDYRRPFGERGYKKIC
jgi:hypothetical protein